MGAQTEDTPRDLLSLLPFVATALMAWVAVIVGSRIAWHEYALASALLLLAGLLASLGLLELRRPWFGRVSSSMTFLAAVAMLRTSAGGISSGVAVLATLPVFYVAFYSEHVAELVTVCVASALFYLLPIVIVGPPDYPHTQYRAALLSVVVSSIVGFATRNLVREARQRAIDARSRERMLAEIGTVLPNLFQSSSAREDICAAARSISGASVAVLYEPGGTPGAMVSTAMVGIDAGLIEIPPGRTSAVTEAFSSGEAILIDGDVHTRVGSPELWEAAGSPQSVLYEPLIRRGRAIGVLVVGWAGVVTIGGPQTTVAALLAHEAASVILRADMVEQLTDMAATDPLTGVPNRRAWDARLRQAIEQNEVFTVAILDLDHFKQFNDTYGHPAGDRLLIETAARWDAQLRGGDMLARLGGEEFGVLLLGCVGPDALEVIERLRSVVADDRTCSAGYATHDCGETAAELFTRADAALYEAKEAGRDRTCMSA